MEAGGTSLPPETGTQAHKLRLKVVAGNAAGEVIEVKDELVIGRQSTGVGTLANDVEISRNHARVRGEGDGNFVLEDLGSTNGTHVNGRRLEGPTTLEAGDRIEVGASTLVVQVSALQPTPRASDTIAPVPKPVGAQETPEGPASRKSPGLALRIEVDFDAGTATVALDENSDRVDFVHEDGSWRIG